MQTVQFSYFKFSKQFSLIKFSSRTEPCPPLIRLANFKDHCMAWKR